MPSGAAPAIAADADADAIEAAAADLDGVRVHQMHVLHDRRYLHGDFGDRLKHISYFLSHITRPYFKSGAIGLVPANVAAALTAVWQSSGVTIGMCFALISAGVFTGLEQVYPIVLGAHIGKNVGDIITAIP